MVAGDLHLPGATGDPKDDPLVVCAVKGVADYLSSGDAVLLDSGYHGDVQVVAPGGLAEILGL